jgi:hypothetical protein
MWSEDYLESMSTDRLLDAIVESQQVLSRSPTLSQLHNFVAYTGQEMCELLSRAHALEPQ